MRGVDFVMGSLAVACLQSLESAGTGSEAAAHHKQAHNGISLQVLYLRNLYLAL